MTDQEPRLPGLHDPDGWREWWLSLHPSALFAGELARFTLSRADPSLPAGVGSGTIKFVEEGDQHEVTVEYVLERFPSGVVLHVVSIRSPGDPLPPVVDEV